MIYKVPSPEGSEASASATITKKLSSEFRGFRGGKKNND